MNIACVLNISVFSITYTHNIVWIQRKKTTKNPKKKTINKIFVSQIRMKSMKQTRERVNDRNETKRNEKVKKTNKKKIKEKTKANYNEYAESALKQQSTRK